jgi:hypothetical protein
VRRNRGQDAKVWSRSVEKPHPLRARVRVITLLAVLLPVVAAGGDEERPDLRLRVTPRYSLAPPGGFRTVLLTAEIVGPETEEYYCPEVVWVWTDSTQSSSESDCDPFEQRSEYPRRFTRRVRMPPARFDYRVCVELRKGGEAVDRSCVRYSVH